MSTGWPWWLNPWREARLANATNRKLIKRNGDLRAASERRDQHIMALEASLADAERRLRQLGGTAEGASTALPDFVLVGIPRPDGSKRLIAARDLPGAVFGMTDMSDPPPRWVIRAVLMRPVTIDRKDYAAGLDHLRTIWSNWDREAAQNRGQVASRWQEGGATGRGQPAIGPYTADAASRVAADRARRGGSTGELPPAG